MHIRSNILGGIDTPDGVLDGTRDVDPEDAWVQDALERRHIIRVRKDGTPLARAPYPAQLPCLLGDVDFLPIEPEWRDVMNDSWVDPRWDEDAPTNKLNKLSVLEIRALVRAGAVGAEVAKVYDIAAATVYNIVARRSWGSVGDGEEIDGKDLRKRMEL